ncbi:hypothetical protein [Microbacterium testaceum]|uniref:DUF4365 domain-containing protein n=1 Tax=Microbacterium testaceum TaxID=2033 RepID=A0A2T7VQ42_MICTE|nr:hypothetical protein [Microbacterium testaceum]PVE58771.1 hypothetical protein DC432_15785 [Microbacterium testaceum]
MSTQHIGAAGELLVQYRLLKMGLDSARLTTDSGVDLVVYSPTTAQAITVQVKTVQEPTPAGGRGKLAVGWNFPHDLRAQVLATVVLSEDAVWLFTMAEARSLAQQHSDRGVRRFYWYTDPATSQVDGVPLRQADMDTHLLAQSAPKLFA